MGYRQGYVREVFPWLRRSVVKAEENIIAKMIKNTLKIFALSQVIILFFIYFSFGLSLNKAKFTEEYIKWLGGSVIVLFTNAISLLRESADRDKAKKELKKKVQLKILNIGTTEINKNISKLRATKLDRYDETKLKGKISRNLIEIENEITLIVGFSEQYCIKYNIVDFDINNNLFSLLHIMKIKDDDTLIETSLRILDEINKIKEGI